LFALARQFKGKHAQLDHLRGLFAGGLVRAYVARFPQDPAILTDRRHRPSNWEGAMAESLKAIPIVLLPPCGATTPFFVPGSMAEFVHAIWNGEDAKHGGATPALGIPSESGIQGPYLTCSQLEWDRRFGSPNNVLDHGGASMRLSMQTWDQVCSDGTVLCVGHLCRSRNGTPWVILFRTCNSGT
jgi:hypothetical protein